ncbi:hypothetical protein VN12_13950 [Pirellula sp. SH-Sr6A]|uniref:hypothetical protein n=1 Tax=Pirellula sp. SH-Sr6A TaxID=1632865 RepID=UPI00078C80EC|nr:hypothetical protein [Pirellula sp. SH-Sr6A]AMV33225.1 hypothetical protein VN12_13950 [Pirellula sp. SH-Sr6A]
MKKPLRTRTRIDQNAHYFQTLGLKRGECRIEIIRDAARIRAKELSGRSHPSTVDLHRAEVAIAAYKLLDPRGRADLYERVQLSCPLDQADNAPPPPPSISPINRSIGRRSTEATAVDATCSIQLMAGEVVDQAIALDEDASEAETEGDSRREPSTLSLAERRQVVELLKKTDDDTPSSRSTLSWLRSYLGI